ncbi:uncharacterized protein DMAD_03519 [Drosophila madeirensis]|uniref:Single domain-containing protein n=1 Tax=Drosophila madeirensis TaxID=30013 RepID=A0AAU9GAV2_DROMD
MKYFLLLLLIGLMPRAHTLVHKDNWGKSADGKGCKTPKGDLKPGGSVQDDKVCGIFFCNSKDGHGLIHYCQIPATFAECSGTGVSTDIDYPDCCWICVKEKDCSQGGDAGKAGKEKATKKPVL